MNSHAASKVDLRARFRTRVADAAELAKIRITAMVAITTAAGFDLAPQPIDWRKFIFTVLGTTFVSAGAGALNQVVESDLDGRMRRTEHRPIPAGRVSEGAATAFALGLAILGQILLIGFVNSLTAGLAAGCLLFYVGVYTPLKTRTTWNTIVGAVAGAIPPVLGWTGATGSLGIPALVLFGILFLWQLPHFFAIAWMYRDDYEAAGYQMLAVVDREGKRLGAQTIVFTILLIAVAALPFPLHLAGGFYLSTSIAFGAIFLYFATRMAVGRTRGQARHLLLASVMYLPAVLAMLVLDKIAN
ncbi:MAG: protoheme IX farnesyltransferase [Planctomycetes bacterium]|nr:protoheme IX farnesyltransferase [Planctomycetota bacterium]